MTDAAIISAEYVEWKMIKTRSALQLIFEVPLEEQGRVMDALGTPLPGTSCPVAIARLRQSGAEPASEPPAIEDQTPPRKPPSLAQIAGILCNERAFWKHIRVANADEAAEYVRSRCGVSTRAALDSNPDAAAIFRTMRADYQVWMSGAAV